MTFTLKVDITPKNLFVFLVILAGLFFIAFPSAMKAQRAYMEPLPVSPTKLVEDYKKNFHSADAMYTGKLLLLTGRIKIISPPQRIYDIHKDKIYAFISMDTGRNRPLAIYFWQWEAEKINKLKTGNTITVMGFCQGVTPQLSIVDACIYPEGCGGPRSDFIGPYYELSPSKP